MLLYVKVCDAVLAHRRETELGIGRFLDLSISLCRSKQCLSACSAYLTLFVSVGKDFFFRRENVKRQVN